MILYSYTYLYKCMSISLFYIIETIFKLIAITEEILFILHVTNTQF